MHDINRAYAEAQPYSAAAGSAELAFEASDLAAEGLNEVFETDEEMELAAELLATSSEAELDQFIGSLIKRAGQAVGKAVKGPLGQKLGGLVKGAVKTVLPIAGSVAGGMFGGPLGAKIGGALAKAGGNALGLELEGLSPEDQEYEVSRQLVRLAGDAVKHAAQGGQNGRSPDDVARAAVVAAARRHAPGLLRAAAGEAEVGGTAAAAAGRSGRWVRQGRNITLLGV